MTVSEARQSGGGLTRRDLLEKLGVAGSVILAPGILAAQGPEAGTRSAAAAPPRDFSPGAPPQPYPDPDVLAIDPWFNALRQFNAPIERLWTGALWSEGPAWSSQGRSSSRPSGTRP